MQRLTPGPWRDDDADDAGVGAVAGVEPGVLPALQRTCHMSTQGFASSTPRE